MFSSVVLFLASGSALPISERAAWYTCLESYAQVQMMSSKEPAALVTEGMTACAKERHSFQTAYQHKISKPTRFVTTNAAAEALATEDLLAGRHMLLFVLRFRLIR